MGILGGGGTLGGGERNCKGDKGKMGDLEPTRLFNPVGMEKETYKVHRKRQTEISRQNER